MYFFMYNLQIGPIYDTVIEIGTYLSKSELAKHPVEPFFEPLLKDFFRGIACYCVVLVLVDQGIEVGCSSFIVQGALQLPQLRLNFCVKSRSHKVIVLI